MRSFVSAPIPTVRGTSISNANLVTRSLVEWWDSYNAYLQTEQWQNVRRRVLERDSYTCQGCLSAEATEVHHITYDHVTREFMFELISLCGACHSRYHDKLA